MSIVQYLTEDGTGSYSSFYVPDIVAPDRSSPSLVFVLESPHSEELRTGTPVSGSAGRSAYRYLVPNAPTEIALGPFIREQIDRGDTRMAMLNVSNVPLQRPAGCGVQALEIHSRLDWSTISSLRNLGQFSSNSPEKLWRSHASSALLSNFREKILTLGLNATSVIVPCGKFAQQYLLSIFGVEDFAILTVPHPARGQWKRARGDDLNNLTTVRRKFDRIISS